MDTTLISAAPIKTLISRKGEYLSSSEVFTDLLFIRMFRVTITKTFAELLRTLLSFSRS